ncbi:hypothetical protein T484DRAFT_1796233 [Baffinella frigidus]|nr:hypothetical protein T484DRAFT_1796233 [Cryptophyta sp. CCMP2293]
MSQRIHPDKLAHFSDATRAFQALVRAYELICKPQLRANESDDSRDGSEDDDAEEDEGREEEGEGEGVGEEDGETAGE